MPKQELTIEYLSSKSDEKLMAMMDGDGRNIFSRLLYEERFDEFRYLVEERDFSDLETPIPNCFYHDDEQQQSTSPSDRLNPISAAQGGAKWESQIASTLCARKKKVIVIKQIPSSSSMNRPHNISRTKYQVERLLEEGFEVIIADDQGAFKKVTDCESFVDNYVVKSNVKNNYTVNFNELRKEFQLHKKDVVVIEESMMMRFFNSLFFRPWDLRDLRGADGDIESTAIVLEDLLIRRGFYSEGIPHNYKSFLNSLYNESFENFKTNKLSYHFLFYFYLCILIVF